MRLLNTKTLQLETYIGSGTPPYAILSHTWEKDEVLFEDITIGGGAWKEKGGANKVVRSAFMAAADGFDFIWIDTCCIDKKSSSELSEAINSMFSWYEYSAICYAYLSDVSLSFAAVETQAQERYGGVKITPDSSFEESRWFTRGWTLQELIAPRHLSFFDQHWQFLGTRAYLAKRIGARTRIDLSVLLPDNHPLDNKGSAATYIPNFKRSTLHENSIHTKMTWAGGRTTTRPEDRAYSLMGLFDVNMPLLYGEGGKKAFRRLQEEIVKKTNDQSILLQRKFQWALEGDVLAETPDDFNPTDSFARSYKQERLSIQTTKHGVEVDLLLWRMPLDLSGSRVHGTEFLGILESRYTDDKSRLHRPAIWLEEFEKDRVYHRRMEDKIFRIRHDDAGQAIVSGDSLVANKPPLMLSGMKRKTVLLTKNWQLRQRRSTFNSVIFMQPIDNHEAVSKYQYGDCCPRRINGLQGVTSSHIMVMPNLALIAFIRLSRSSGGPSIGILIFCEHYIGAPDGETDDDLAYVFPHMVEVKRWWPRLEEDMSLTIHDLRDQLWRLPLNQAESDYADDAKASRLSNSQQNVQKDIVIGSIIQTRGPRDGPASILTLDGIRITVKITQHNFLEEPVHHLHVDVANEMTSRALVAEMMKKVSSHYYDGDANGQKRKSIQ
ncbi:HET-domain-containing protein [Xylariaceae sp. FL1272]|nr:HET-domain-containing protein [Xylariaceae sp. FL1272]